MKSNIVYRILQCMLSGFIALYITACAGIPDYGPYRDAPNVEIAERTKLISVAPVYPSYALRNDVKGWVYVKFTVNTQGATENLQIEDQYPGNVFGNEALKAVKYWRYNPANSSTEVSEVILFDWNSDLNYSRQLQ